MPNRQSLAQTYSLQMLSKKSKPFSSWEKMMLELGQSPGASKLNALLVFFFSEPTALGKETELQGCSDHMIVM